MKIESKKISVPKNKLDINVTFYFFLKHLVKLKLSDIQAQKLYISLIHNHDKKQALIDFKDVIKKSKSKLNEYENIIDNIDDNSIELFVFSLQLIMIKDLLKNEADFVYIAKQTSLSNHDPLSLTYDRESLLIPYTRRVNSALFSLIFFDKLEQGETNFISQSTEDYLKTLSVSAKKLKLQGVEPNQVFMLIFSESIDQAIKSDSGSDYEQRIFNVLTKIGIPANTISKEHDDKDKSTEYDFKFELAGKTFGIGAKKTLRERYKQYIKTSVSSSIDVDIEITIGLDLNEEKARIIREHGTIIFVADEIYQQKAFLQKMEGIYSTNKLTLTTLLELAGVK